MNDAGAPVIIVDDHQLFSSSLCLALRVHGHDAHQIPVTGAESILAAVARWPDGALVLLDLVLSADGLNGATLVPALVEQRKRVLVITGGGDPGAIAYAVAAGAIGVLIKSAPLSELLTAIGRAAAGERIMDSATRRSWLARHRRGEVRRLDRERRLARLSPREHEVLQLLAHGYRAADIVERRVVSMATVRTQIRTMLIKLEVNSQLEAVALLRDVHGDDRELEPQT